MLYHIGLPLVRMWEERILTDVIVGLDIGTSNIRVAIGEVTEEMPGRVVVTTEIGAETLLPPPGGELLPRIC